MARKVAKKRKARPAKKKATRRKPAARKATRKTTQGGRAKAARKKPVARKRAVRKPKPMGEETPAPSPQPWTPSGESWFPTQ